jgi:hypothetical protein
MVRLKADKILDMSASRQTKLNQASAYEPTLKRDSAAFLPHCEHVFAQFTTQMSGRSEGVDDRTALGEHALRCSSIGRAAQKERVLTWYSFEFVLMAGCAVSISPPLPFAAAEEAFMKRRVVVGMFISGLGCVLFAQAPPPPAPAVDTTVCDVVKKPTAFDGKIVRIKGTVVSGLDEFVIKDSTDPNCGYPVNVIWLSYPQGTKGKAGPAAMLTVQPARNFAGKYTAPTRTPVTLDKSKDFKQFDSLLAQKHEKGADMCLGCTRYEVTATLVGRLDAVADASLKRDASGKIVGFGGFGNMNAYPARLVLQSVSDVTPKEIDFSKNDDETKGEQAQPLVAASDFFPAIDVAQKSVGGLMASPAKDMALKAAAAFGKAGDRFNGAFLGMGVSNEAATKDEALGTKDSPDGVLFNCSFNTDRLPGNDLIMALIHMGDHVSELRNPEAGNAGAPAIILESNAWVVTSVTTIGSGLKFLTAPGGYVMWDANWSAAARNDKMQTALKDFLASEALLSQ